MAEDAPLPDIRIPVARPDLSGNEQKYVQEAIASSWISSTGPYNTRFEQSIASLCGAQGAITVCNGTVALHLALLTLDVRRGDEVIVPSLTYVATANAVRYMGAEPVFVDVDPKTWCMDPSQIETAVTARTRGIIPVHLYGHPADMDEINRLAGIHGLWVVEDAAEAPFGRYKNRPVGGLGTIGTFSFYGNKVLTSGEGGALTINDSRLELRARTLRGQGVDPQRRYYFPVTGYNYRLTNVACALLVAQLERYEELLAKRRRLFALYHERLAGIDGLGFQPVAPWAVLSPWLFCLTVDLPGRPGARDQLSLCLRRRGIETRPFFVPLHRLPPFREESARRGEGLPVTTHLASTGLNLPTFSAMSESDVDEVTDAIQEWRRCPS
jgi:perosamine synthetase